MTLSRSFFLLTLSFVCLTVGAVAGAIALGSAGLFPSAVLVSAASLALAAVLLWRQAARDLDAVLTLAGSFALLTAVSVAIYLFNATTPGLPPKLVLVGTALVGVGCAVATYRRQRSSSADFPNVLSTMAPTESIFETEGVQFAGTIEQGSGKSPHFLSVFLQNCFDFPRRVTIRFDPAGYESYLRFVPEHSVQLGPAEVTQIVFGVIAPTYERNYPFFISIVVADGGGKRVRLWRAQEATNRIKTSTSIALLAAGHIAFGGGVRLTIGPLPEDIWASDLPQPRRLTLWEPRPGAVPWVQPAA